MRLEEKIEYLKEEIAVLKETVNIYRFCFLTGLKQRRDFDYDLRLKFKEHDFFVCYYDVDNLHKTNRDKGFAEGDRLIRQVAGDIQHQAVLHSTYRTSGDEIYAICCKQPTDDVENATMVKVHTEKFETIDEMTEELDRLMIEKKTVKKTRRMDD